MRGCGGISKPRNSTRPRRPVAESGEYSLSIQNSARWVFPVISANRLRNTRSTSQGDATSPPGSCRNAMSSSYKLSSRASSTRGACEVGADKHAGEQVGKRRVVLPIAHQAARTCGLRSIGLSAGVGPPRVTWLPPPVPVCRPSSMNFSVPNRARRALVQDFVVLDHLLPATGRVHIDLYDPGSGVTEKRLSRGSCGAG